ELVRRSRTVPYQDGIRTDLGERPVPPGATVAVQARLLAPNVPGVYWLQWDMVEEGVTWFAQVSPRQPRTLVVVAPPVAYLLAPVPLLVAMFGLAFARARRDAGAGEAGGARRAWGAAALAVKPPVAAHEALLEPTAVAYWLVLAVAIVIPATAFGILSHRVRPWILVAIGLFASLLLLADVLYYRFFGDVVSTPALLAARQTGHVWGSVGSLFTPGLLWLVADVPFAVWLAMRISRSPSPPPPWQRVLAPATAVAAIAAAGAVVSAPRVLASASLDQMFRARAVMEQLGPLGYHAYDTWNYARATWLRPPVGDAQIAVARA